MLWGHARHLILWLGIIGFLANSSQAGVRIDQDEILVLKMCGSGNKTIQLELPKTPPESNEIHDCEACSPSIIEAYFVYVLNGIAWLKPKTEQGLTSAPVSPRSPLWPGAPPQGPPIPHKADL